MQDASYGSPGDRRKTPNRFDSPPHGHRRQNGPGPKRMRLVGGAGRAGPFPNRVDLQREKSGISTKNTIDTAQANGISAKNTPNRHWETNFSTKNEPNANRINADSTKDALHATQKIADAPNGRTDIRRNHRFLKSYVTANRNGTIVTDIH